MLDHFSKPILNHHLNHHPILTEYRSQNHPPGYLVGNASQHPVPRRHPGARNVGLGRLVGDQQVLCLVGLRRRT
jgi:hypothetical protein